LFPAKTQSRKEDQILRRAARFQNENCACGAKQSLALRLCVFAGNKSSVSVAQARKEVVGGPPARTMTEFVTVLHGHA
jgi:hypothetical protein